MRIKNGPVTRLHYCCVGQAACAFPQKRGEQSTAAIVEVHQIATVRARIFFWANDMP